MSASRYPFRAAPDGWYGVVRSDELAAGALLPLRLLGRELVAFRGEDGCARVWGAHCPHLGAHLGVGGRVCGGGLVCPFHGWRFDGDGRLAEVPRLTRTPPAVGADALPACERNGFVFVWHHAQRSPPAYPVIGYRDDEASWTPWRSSRYRVRVHVQDLTENILDRAHFVSVHDMAEPERELFEVRFEGPSLVVEQALKVTAVAAQGVEILSRTTTCGPGIAAVEVKQGSLDMLTYITQTPIDDEHTEVGLHFSMRRLADEAATRAVSELNDRVTKAQFEQDVPIWEHKIYRERPALTEVDGPVAQYRRWFRQFYSEDEGRSA